MNAKQQAKHTITVKLSKGEFEILRKAYALKQKAHPALHLEFGPDNRRLLAREALIAVAMAIIRAGKYPLPHPWSVDVRPETEAELALRMKAAGYDDWPGRDKDEGPNPRFSFSA